MTAPHYLWIVRRFPPRRQPCAVTNLSSRPRTVACEEVSKHRWEDLRPDTQAILKISGAAPHRSAALTRAGMWDFARRGNVRQMQRRKASLASSSDPGLTAQVYSSTCTHSRMQTRCRPFKRSARRLVGEAARKRGEKESVQQGAWSMELAGIREQRVCESVSRELCANSLAVAKRSIRSDLTDTPASGPFARLGSRTSNASVLACRKRAIVQRGRPWKARAVPLWDNAALPAFFHRPRAHAFGRPSSAGRGGVRARA
ncbi:hypothetical protein ANO11243_058910 [Dothideomycetidae sp. 11243]|nr:hypothetical protein ANO11243_058910 [fungal sp. No.11243]